MCIRDSIGDDDTCMPGKPECANWLDSNDFPEEYVTVNAECICGAKLEELQDSGEYVHTGTVLQSTRKRALHEDDAVDDDDHWEWPDAVRSGIDQFHGKTFIASLVAPLLANTNFAIATNGTGQIFGTSQTLHTTKA